MFSDDPFPSGFNKQNPFGISQTYFDNLPSQLEHKARLAEHKRDLKFGYTLAASFFILLSIGSMLLFRQLQINSSQLEMQSAYLAEHWYYPMLLDEMLLEPSANASSAIWETLLDENLLHEVDRQEVIEYYFEQEEFDF